MTVDVGCGRRSRPGDNDVRLPAAFQRTHKLRLIAFMSLVRDEPMSGHFSHVKSCLTVLSVEDYWYRMSVSCLIN